MPTTAIPPVTALLVIAVLVPILFIAYHAIKEIIMSQQDQINAVVAKLAKVETEVVGTRDTLLDEIKALKDQIAAGIPAPELDLSGLTDVAQRLDDLTPDAEESTVLDDIKADEPAAEQ